MRQVHESHSLRELMYLSSETDCAQKCDRVYALLGLLHDGDPAILLEANYTISTTQLLFRVLSKLQTTRSMRSLGVERLLRALSLPYSTLVTAASDVDLGDDVVYVSTHGNSGEHGVFPELSGLYGDRHSTGGVRGNDVCRFPRQHGPLSKSLFCFLFRHESDRWRCTGWAWSVCLPSSRYYLPYIDSLERFFMTQSLPSECVLTEPDFQQGFDIPVRKLFSAAVEILSLLFDPMTALDT